MVVFVVSDTAFIGVTRMTSNCILIKSSIFCSASAFILSISVGDHLKNSSIIVCLYPGTYLISKSNSRIQVSYLIINTPGRSVPDLLS